jgi:8-oxo-dGTP diphosphatase
VCPAGVSLKDMTYPTHIVAVSGLFRNDAGQVLLVKTPVRGWECPGGLVELGEDLMEALAREVLEESCCQVQIDRLVGVYTRTSTPEAIVFMFEGRHLAGSPQPGSETVDAGWSSTEQALALVTHPPSAGRLRDALAGLSRPVYRVYTNRPYTAKSQSSL